MVKYIYIHYDSMYTKSKNMQSYFTEISTAGLDGNTIKKSKDVIAIKVIIFYSIISRIGRWREIMIKKDTRLHSKVLVVFYFLLPLTSTFMFYKLLYMLHNKKVKKKHISQNSKILAP